MIDWGKVEQFVERKFRRSRSLHTRRYYEAGVRRFRRFAESEGIGDVDGESVYEVLDRFVQWLDAQGIKPKTVSGYVHAARKFLLYLDVRIDAARFREKVELPRVLKIEDEPLSMETVRKVVSIGRPNKKMLALILLLLSSGMRLDSLINDQPESGRKVSALTIGLNRLVRYGYAQDRFVAGSIGISGLEFTGIVRNGTLRADQTVLVDKGKLIR